MSTDSSKGEGEVRVWNNRGIIEKREGTFDEAEKAFKKALEIEP
jgi:Flp pilus assembly protein TadD